MSEDCEWDGLYPATVSRQCNCRETVAAKKAKIATSVNYLTATFAILAYAPCSTLLERMPWETTDPKNFVRSML